MIRCTNLSNISAQDWANVGINLENVSSRETRKQHTEVGIQENPQGITKTDHHQVRHEMVLADGTSNVHGIGFGEREKLNEQINDKDSELEPCPLKRNDERVEDPKEKSISSENGTNKMVPDTENQADLPHIDDVRMAENGANGQLRGKELTEDENADDSSQARNQDNSANDKPNILPEQADNGNTAGTSNSPSSANQQVSEDGANFQMYDSGMKEKGTMRDPSDSGSHNNSPHVTPTISYKQVECKSTSATSNSEPIGNQEVAQGSSAVPSTSGAQKEDCNLTATTKSHTSLSTEHKNNSPDKGDANKIGGIKLRYLDGMDRYLQSGNINQDIFFQNRSCFFL